MVPSNQVSSPSIRSRRKNGRIVDRKGQMLDEVLAVLDVGCGFGKTTLALADRWPDAEIVGLDLAGPCLNLRPAPGGNWGWKLPPHSPE